MTIYLKEKNFSILISLIQQRIYDLSNEAQQISEINSQSLYLI